MEWASSTKNTVCSGLAEVGLECSANLISLNLWHVLVFFVLFVFSVLVVRFVFRYSPISEMRSAYSLTYVERGSVNRSKTLQIDAFTLARLLKESARIKELGKRDAASYLNEKYGSKFFVVEFRENGNKLFRTELKLRAAWWGSSRTKFRTDPVTLGKLKDYSASPRDDGTGDNIGAIGEFDVHVREVRPWDLRHWINHPTRETRLAIWVAMFAAALEYSADFVDFVSAIVRA